VARKRATTAAGDEAPKAGGKRTKVKQTDLPRHSLTESLRIPQALADEYGKKATSPANVATALGMSRTSSRFRTIAGAAVAYGLTTGGPNAPSIGLTPLGRRIVAPTVEGDDLVAKREALVKPRIIRDFLTRYNENRLPSEQIAKNVLEELGVAADAVNRTYDVLMRSAKEAGVLRDTGAGTQVDLGGVAPAEQAVVEVEEPEAEEEAAAEEVKEEAAPAPSEMEVEKPKPKPIFIGHGKNKGPRDKLVKILDQFKIPYKVAIIEPNLGRPIPRKVKDVMSECGSAILIFTADEEFTNAKGETVWRPSENVVYELGAASFAYEDRIVIFMEEGLHFPANFESVGRIDFQEDAIEAKTMDLLKELVGFGLVKITPA